MRSNPAMKSVLPSVCLKSRGLGIRQKALTSTPFFARLLGQKVATDILVAVFEENRLRSQRTRGLPRCVT